MQNLTRLNRNLVKILLSPKNRLVVAAGLVLTIVAYSCNSTSGSTPVAAAQSPALPVLTVASIVEREAVIPAERPDIAGVYLNRLAQGIRLEADPTVQYAMGYQAETGQWWKTPVFLEEYSSVVSPYNTYLNDGLTPGPIASPGLSSIEAVLNPGQHDYLYFVATPDGTDSKIDSFYRRAIC